MSINKGGYVRPNDMDKWIDGPSTHITRLVNDSPQSVRVYTTSYFPNTPINLQIRTDGKPTSWDADFASPAYANARMTVAEAEQLISLLTLACERAVHG